jgi:hypothetical protein
MDEEPIRSIEESGDALAQFIRAQGPVLEALGDVAQQARARGIAAVERSR